MAVNKYADLSWTASDIQMAAPKMTDAEAEEWLANNAKHLRDRLCELGWGIIETLLHTDGIDTSTEPQYRCQNCEYEEVECMFVPSDGKPVERICPECDSVDVFPVD